MEAFVLDTSRLVSDVIGYVAELKNEFHSSGDPINDDNTTLQKLCVKFETILRHEQKEKYSFLGYRKDYWNFIIECIPKDDGVKYVQAVPQMKTAQGKGRCFIRYALTQKTLADAVQRLMVNKNLLSSWYRSDAIFRNPSLSTALVNKLYDLNDVNFDLPCGGYDLDISWPAFSRRKIREGSTSGRRNSVSSIASVDFRNERQDPLVGLATEIASLEAFFNSEFSEVNVGKEDTFDNVSISASIVDTPPISELTLKISHIHQQGLKWKSTTNSERAMTAHELKKAQDDKHFAIRESELKNKQMIEKFSTLAKVKTEESDTKCSELAVKLSEAEEALQERDLELKQLRNEVNKSVVESSTAQKSAIELEKQLMMSDRKQSEFETEIESLRLKLQSKEHIEIEFDFKEKQLKEKMDILESKKNEYKESISELQGNLRAKEVALQSIQVSFEKLNGMVFGSFEELEADMKQRLLEKEKGLQNQTVENRKLELNVEELQQQIRDKRTKLSEAKSQLEDLKLSYKEAQSSKEKMSELLKERDELLQEHEVFVNELGTIIMEEGKASVDTVDGMETTKQYLIKRCHNLFDEVQSFQIEMVSASKMIEEAEQRFDEKEQQLQERNAQLEKLQAANHKTREEFDVLMASKDDLDKEKVVIEEELRTALSSLDDLHSEHTQASQSNTEQEEELIDLRDRIHRQTKLTQEHKQQIRTFEDKCQDLQNTIETLKLDLSIAQDKVMSLDSESIDSREKLNALTEDLRNNRDDKVCLEDEIIVAKQQLESANEGRIRAEHAQVKAQEELEKLQCMMDQEVAALKFQLSSETIKFETEIKVLSEESQESARFKDRSLEQEDTIADLEIKLKEKSDEWQSEKRKYVNEIKHLRHEVQLLKNALDGNKQKMTTLENDLLLTTKQLDEERARQKDLKRKILEVNEQKVKSENELKQEMENMEDDMRELKTKIVSLTREKADFWKKADDLEHELKLKSSDRWVEDSEVKQCTDCRTEFSFLIRKHHCRLCGRIFCHSCVNNWAKTAHSSKLKRVCDFCVANDQQLKIQKGPRRQTDTGEEDFDETMSDISIGASPIKGTRSSTLQSVNDESIMPTTSQTSHEESVYSPTDPSTTSSPNEDKTMTTDQSNQRTTAENSDRDTVQHDSEYLSFAKANTSSGTTSPREGVSSPVGEGFEVIDPHEEIFSDKLESRVVLSDTDHKEDLVIPAVNDEQGVSRGFTVMAGTRYVLPVMVATPGAILCWSFTIVYKSIIFGIAFKSSEKHADEHIETLFPLTRYSSNVTPVEGEWKTACHGVYLLVFDNTYSRFTSKDLTCKVQVKRRPSLLHTPS